MQSICTRENRHSHTRVLPPPPAAANVPAVSLEGMFVSPCSAGAPWKSPLHPSCTFLWLLPATAPGEPRALLLPQVPTPSGCSLQRHNSLSITPGTHRGRGSDPSPEEGSTTAKAPPGSSARGGQAAPGEHGTVTPDRHPRPSLLCCHQRFHHLLRQHSPFPQPSSSPSTQQCPSLLVCPQPPFQGQASHPRAKGSPSRWPIRGTSRSRGAYPGGRASGAGTAARAGAVLELEASSASLASPALGRAGAPELSAPLTGAGALATAVSLSSSLSAAPAVSPFTAKAEGRNLSTPKGLMNSTHAALAAEHTGGGSHCHRAQDQRYCQQRQQLLHPAARSLWNRCHCLHPGTNAEGTLRLCPVSPLPPANILRA